MLLSPAQRPCIPTVRLEGPEGSLISGLPWSSSRGGVAGGVGALPGYHPEVPLSGPGAGRVVRPVKEPFAPGSGCQ